MPKVDRAPAALKYLSARCASLNDAIRTAPARGLKHDVINQLRKEYSDECSESERQADAQLSLDRKDKSKQLNDARQAETLDKERAAIREQQCGESKRILFAKRARTDLTEGEKADLRRFEDNYRSRCG
jgi:selenocysteine-specific translation elongation factor